MWLYPQRLSFFGRVANQGFLRPDADRRSGLSGLEERARGVLHAVKQGLRVEPHQQHAHDGAHQDGYIVIVELLQWAPPPVSAAEGMLLLALSSVNLRLSAADFSFFGVLPVDKVFFECDNALALLLALRWRVGRR